MILANDFVRLWADIGAEATAVFERVGGSGWYILGSEVKQFERALAEYWQVEHCIGVASGLDALEISLRIGGCGPGSKVLTTPLSAFATTLAIIRLGATPVFVDTDRFGLMDFEAARAALQDDPSIRFLLPVHLYGHALDRSRLQSLVADFNVELVEDCAQSAGALSHGQPTGTTGRIAASSFYPTKNLGAMGDGGIILTHNEEWAREAQALRDYGQTAKYRHDRIGYNSRLDELQAALLHRVALPRLARWTERRRSIAARYVAELRHPAVKVPGQPPQSDSCWHLFPVLVEPARKPAFLSHLKTYDIAAGEHYPLAIPDQTALSSVPHQIASSGIEQSRRFCSSEVSLPIHPYLSDAEVTTVVEAVNAWEA